VGAERAPAVDAAGRRGTAARNVVAESFFATRKTERVDHEVYAARASAVTSIAEYIDVFYNL
jgi:transposase InsO family protein